MGDAGASVQIRSKCVELDSRVVAKNYSQVELRIYFPLHFEHQKIIRSGKLSRNR